MKPTVKVIYKSKGDWFDKDTYAILLDDYRVGSGVRFNAGLFAGIKNGKEDEEVCGFDEFDVVRTEE